MRRVLRLSQTDLMYVGCVSGGDRSDNVRGNETCEQHHASVPHLVCNACRYHTVRHHLPPSTELLLLSRLRACHRCRVSLLSNIDLSVVYSTFVSLSI